MSKENIHVAGEMLNRTFQIDGHEWPLPINNNIEGWDSSVYDAEGTWMADARTVEHAKLIVAALNYYAEREKREAEVAELKARKAAVNRLFLMSDEILGDSGYATGIRDGLREAVRILEGKDAD